MQVALERIHTQRPEQVSMPPVTPFQDTLDLRREVIDACLYMRDRLGYIVGTWGNISVRVPEGLLVTPSKMSYEKLTPDDLVVVAWEGGVLKGERLPTSETQLHRRLMRERPDLGALIHTHSPWASVCACAHKSIPVLLDDMAEVIGGEVHCSVYVPAGRHAQLAEAAAAAIGPDATAVLLGNHGVVAGGRDLQEAVVACQSVEKAAMALVLGEGLGGSKPIPPDACREERERYLYRYGRREDFTELLERSDADGGLNAPRG